MPFLKHGDLMSLYRASEQVDSKIFSEMRSNVRLVAGDHYLRGVHKDLSRNPYAKNLGNDTKIRLTQNHISKASNIWKNSILNAAPDVDILPNNKNELKDQKAAEMHASVKGFLYKQERLDAKIRKLASDYIDIGEVAVKLFYDPSAGPLVDGPVFEEVDSETGQSLGLFQEKTPIGSIKFERILGFNLLRDPSAKDWDETTFVIVRKMMDKKELMSQFKGEEGESKRRMIQESGEETYKVYADSNQDSQESKKVLVLEYYFKPSSKYPKGYFYVSTTMGTLYQGNLPAGVFPIIIENFDDIQTTPRGRSKIKQLRPIQAEINRAVSKMAEHQVTLGDDKLLVPAGTKLQESNKISGVRAIQVGGLAPTVLPGRAGDQYLNYLSLQIDQFYKIAEVQEIEMDQSNNMDVFSIMYRSMKNKKRFSLYADKFESFLIRMWETALRLYKFHVPEYAALPAIGSHDMINMDEFKSSEDIGFQIKLKPRSDDPETLVGKQFALTQFMQYAGQNLEPVDVGRIAANMPFLGKEDFAVSASLKYDRATNMILKLDKGKDLPASRHDDPEYMLQRLDKRMSESDFDQLTAKGQDGQVLPNEVIQELYEIKRQQYEQILAERMLAEQQRQAGMIPASGELIPVQMYTSEPKADGSGFTTKREQFPYDALKWLKDTLIAQGMTEETIQGFDSATREDLNNMLAPQPTEQQFE